MSHFFKNKCALFIIISDYLHRPKGVSKERRYSTTEPFLHKRQNVGERILAADETAGQFYNILPMSQADFEDFLNLIGLEITEKDRNLRQAVSVKEKLVITLRSLATEDSFISLEYLFKVLKQAISSIVPEVCNVLIEALKDYVKIIPSEEEWLAVAKKFEALWNFPNCIDSMDGKHIISQSPKWRDSDFFNYKGFFSIVLYTVVDADHNFIFADVGCQGIISNGRVFKNNVIHHKMPTNSLDLRPTNTQKEMPYVFAADEDFLLTENIIKPYGGLHPKESKERTINYRLNRVRRVVENVFGIMSVFRMLRKRLLLEPQKAEVIVMAIVHLHNFLRKSRRSQSYNLGLGLTNEKNRQRLDEILMQEDRLTSFHPLKNVPHRSSLVAKEIREALAECEWGSFLASDYAE